METINDFLVVLVGDGVAMLNPPRGEFTQEQAVRLAAWLVALADHKNEFPAVLQAINNA